MGPIDKDSLHEQMFAPEMYARVRLPLSQACTLPPYAYTSPEWYQREVERVFFEQWIFVARAEEVAEPGDYLRIDLVGEPIILVRDKERNIRAMSASCRHRGSEVATGKGKCAAFKCPFHGWTYSLTGELIGVPGMEGVEAFDRKAWGLVPVRAETWGGFVFVNFDANAPPLLSCMGDLPERLKSYRLEDMRVTKKWGNRLACNWKIRLENSREGYHADVVHRDSYRRFFPNRPKGEWRYQGIPGVYEILSGTNDDGLYLPRDHVFPFIDGLSHEDQESTHFLIFYPNFLLNLTPVHIAMVQLLPEGPEATTEVIWMCFPKSIIERPDFAPVVVRYYEMPEMFMYEDKEICAVVQRGLRARLAGAGRFSLEERPCYVFQNYLLDRLLNGVPERPRA